MGCQWWRFQLRDLRERRLNDCPEKGRILGLLGNQDSTPHDRLSQGRRELGNTRPMRTTRTLLGQRTSARPPAGVTGTHISDPTITGAKTVLEWDFPSGR